MIRQIIMAVCITILWVQALSERKVGAHEKHHPRGR